CSFFFSYYHYRSILPFFVPSASEICALSLRDALPICDDARLLRARGAEASLVGQPRDADPPELSSAGRRRAQTREGELYARGVRARSRREPPLRCPILEQFQSLRAEASTVVNGHNEVAEPNERNPMELQRLGPIGQQIPAACIDGVCFDLRPLTADIDSDFFAAGGIERVAAALDAGELTPLAEADEMRIGAPLTRPSSIVCVGMNYAAHAAEAGAEPPEQPVVFFKMPSTIAGPTDPIELPPEATKVDWEVEL